MHDIDSWGDEEWAQALRLVGELLATPDDSGRHLSFTDAVYEAARRLTEGTTADPVAMGDEIHNWLADNRYEYAHDFVSMSWKSHHPGGGWRASLEVLDLGSGHFFFLEPSDDGTPLNDFGITDIVESLESSEVYDLVVDFLLQGMVPDWFSVPSLFSRDDIHGIFTGVLDQKQFVGWPEMAEIAGWSEPFESEEDRRRLLDSYLDTALTIRPTML